MRERFAHSENQGLSSFHLSATAQRIDFVLVVIAQAVKAYAILFRIHRPLQFAFEHSELRRIHHYFKYRILHTSAIALAQLGHLPQALRTARIGSIDVIGDHEQHRSSPPYKGRIAVACA